MAFELAESTAVTITNANPRRELHGEEKVRAIDISFTLTGENTLLDLLELGLREHHYCNKAATAGQEALPGVLIPLPNLRHPLLPTSFAYAKKQKWRGYRFIWDYGLNDAHVDFVDAVLKGLEYEIHEGGSVTIRGTVEFNGDELNDNVLYGELSGLASEEEVYIKLLAPAQLIQAKRGYRAGRPDTPASQPDNADQQELREEGEDEPPTDPNHPVNQTPEDAFTAAVTGGPA